MVFQRSALLMSRQSLIWAIGALLTFGLSFSLSSQFFERQQRARFWETTGSKKELGEQISRLASHDSKSFVDAAFVAGFTRSRLIHSVIDVLQRLPDGRLYLSGWAVDIREPDKPVSVFLIIPKKIVFTIDTHARRDDVAEALRLPLDLIKPGFHYTYDHTVSCDLARDLFIIVANAKREYRFIKPVPELQGC